jgi:CHAT domain-containing protein
MARGGEALPPVYLADRLSLVYRPSSQPLGETRSRRRQRSFLGIAFSPRRGTAVATAAGKLVVDPLPGATSEVRRLARHFAHGRTLVGARATSDAALAAMRSRDLVHVCAHALSDAQVPALSGVLLAPPDGASRADLLSADRIARARIGASLVTLAACDTSHGELRLHEGVLSVARAFLAAGAGAVVASLWPVDHAAARATMLALYRHIARGMRPEAALAAATRDLRHARGGREAWGHPYFWAPFILFEWPAPGRS